MQELMLSLRNIGIRQKSPLTGRLFVERKVLHKLPFTLSCRAWTRQRGLEGRFEEDQPFSEFPHCNPTKLCISELSRCADLLYSAMCATSSCFIRAVLIDLQMTEMSQSSVCTHSCKRVCAQTHTHTHHQKMLSGRVWICAG